jgi:hypothetical protein
MKNISDHHTYVIKDAEDRGFTLLNDYWKLEEKNPVKSYRHFWQGQSQLHHINYFQGKNHIWNFKKSKYGGYTIHTATDNDWALTHTVSCSTLSTLAPPTKSGQSPLKVSS